MSIETPMPSFLNQPAVTKNLDHDNSGSNRYKVVDVIDSDIPERDAGEKPPRTPAPAGAL
ncbi:hypothetical protein [Nitrobacter sp.]|jgi:hypothetical protein|uniref:hypothetical protein n=1 Tax=Nitrobacter sp. TaxID=29420 RepID=UPI0029CAB14D|nr:hypothetical protein [Nitrobacter sp.]